MLARFHKALKATHNGTYNSNWMENYKRHDGSCEKSRSNARFGVISLAFSYPFLLMTFSFSC